MRRSNLDRLKAAFAPARGVLQVGAFLGLGGRLIAIPYDSLNISEDGRKIILAGASKEELGKLPEYQDKK